MSLPALLRRHPLLGEVVQRVLVLLDDRHGRQVLHPPGDEQGQPSGDDLAVHQRAVEGDVDLVAEGDGPGDDAAEEARARLDRDVALGCVDEAVEVTRGEELHRRIGDRVPVEVLPLISRDHEHEARGVGRDRGQLPAGLHPEVTLHEDGHLPAGAVDDELRAVGDDQLSQQVGRRALQGQLHLRWELDLREAVLAGGHGRTEAAEGGLLGRVEVRQADAGQGGVGGRR